jgi:hypothetical protein
MWRNIMGGLVMGNSADVPAHIVPVDRPNDGTSRLVGLDGEGVEAGGETGADVTSRGPSATDITIVPIANAG